jgi:hypothetical protein
LLNLSKISVHGRSTAAAGSSIERMTYSNSFLISAAPRPVQRSLAKTARRAEGWRRSLRGQPGSFPTLRVGPSTLPSGKRPDREPLVFDVGGSRRLRSDPPSLATRCSHEAVELLDGLGIAGGKARAHRLQELYHALDDAAVAGNVGLFEYARGMLPNDYLAEQCDRTGLLLRLWHGDRSGGDDADACAATMVAELLSAGARWNIRNEHGETPLHLAAVARPKTLAVLCKHLPAGALGDAEWFATGRDGHTPLHRAARFDNEQSTRVLLAHGADCFRRSVAGETARDVAMRFGAFAVVSAHDRWIEERRAVRSVLLPSLLDRLQAVGPCGPRPVVDTPAVSPAMTFCGTSDVG